MSDGQPNGSAKWSKYTITDGTLERKNNFCPKCGRGVFLAKHNDRESCGRCGFTSREE